MLADYTRSLSGLETPEGFDAAQGAELFAANCAACHGETGAGIREMGAPNLTDGIWLYGSSREVILEGLVNGRGGMMPHFGERLDDATVKGAGGLRPHARRRRVSRAARAPRAPGPTPMADTKTAGPAKGPPFSVDPAEAHSSMSVSRIAIWNW